MAMAGVVDRDPGRGLQSRPKHRLVFGDQTLDPLAQQTNHLALGDVHAHARQQRGQSFRRHLTLEMASGDEPPKFGAVAPQNPRRQRRDDPLASRPRPAFAPIAQRLHDDPQILNQDVLVAQKPGPGRRRSLQHHIPRHRQLVALGAAPAFGTGLAGARRCRLLHARGLAAELRPRRQTLEPRNLVLQRLIFCPKQRQFLDQRRQQHTLFRPKRTLERFSGRRRHPQGESRRPPHEKPPRTGICPTYIGTL